MENFREIADYEDKFKHNGNGKSINGVWISFDQDNPRLIGVPNSEGGLDVYEQTGNGNLLEDLKVLINEVYKG